jgi:phage-related baseplate assembly protein
MGARMTAPTLTGFLLARIADDEKRLDTVLAEWGIAEFRRAEAECEAKRRIVEKAKRADAAFRQSMNPASSAAMFALAQVVEYLALPYADHPDYRDEWRS